MPYAQVAVNAPGAGRRPFSYSVPAELAGRARPGHGVIVPFGRYTFQGIVVAITEEPGYSRTRPIQSLIDDDPIIAGPLIGLGQWIAERYHVPLYVAYRPMLPPAFERRQTIIVSVTAEGRKAIERVSPGQAEILDLVLAAGETTIAAIRDEFGASAARHLTALTGRGYLDGSEVWEGPRISPRLATHVNPAIPAHQLLTTAAQRRSTGAFRQADALEALAANPGARLSDLRRISGASRESWDALVQAGFIALEQRETRRDPLASRSGADIPVPDLRLTPHQQDALNQVTPRLDEQAHDVFLLHGVTGSGKTEVYLRAFRRVIELGRKGIMLVPEIALTPQTIGRFWERFPGRIAVLHSGLSLREQYDEWRSIREGQFDIVIGSRRAALAPMPDVGLIVVDEEHEWTYKQESPAPRYHARDVIIERARREGALVLLGSATPDIGTMHAALRNKITLLELPGRIVSSDTNGQTGWTERPLADVEVIDLRRELLEGNRSMFSRVLRQATSEALGRDEQAILFVNRRGAGQAVQCRSCGHTLHCRRCSTVMTFHADEHIVCHLCGDRRRSPAHCPKCRRNTIRAIGVGTERVVMEAEAAFPGARVIRWDRDAVNEAHGHEPILADFAEHRADILVGTQMVAKGLDFPNVTIVGVVNADIGLHTPDFRASERIFQLLCQVAGRAGRGHAPGRVIIQTYEPEHQAIQAAAAQDYRQFYMVETQFRRDLRYPPYSRMARLTCTRNSSRDVQTAAHQLARALKTEVRSRGMINTRIIGPAPAQRERLRGRYRWQITILADEPTEILEIVPLPPGWIIDIDP